jgi:signal transduction histidine kinase
MSFGKLPNFTRTVAFRLTVWYAVIFTGSTLVAFAIFYLVLQRGIHHVYISERSLHELLETYTTFFAYSLGVIAVGSIFVGWLLAQRALLGVKAVTHTAISIAGHDLGRRVPVRGTQDEIDRLAIAFNEMLERIETVLRSMKEITDNIAHDLRSPITRMRGVAEMSLVNETSNEGQAAMAGTVVEECDRLLGIINTMLSISEAESGLARLDLKEIDLMMLLNDVSDLFQPLAEDKGISLSVQGPPSLALTCDLHKLQRVFANLLDNAIKYTPEKGKIAITAMGNGREVSITVEDTGRGIPEEDTVHLFDRFFRGEKSRSQPGSGLGLSLAQALILIHNGTISVTSVPGQGSRFAVILPKIEAQCLPAG